MVAQLDLLRRPFPLSEVATNSEHMAVRVSNMHFSDIPGMVGRRRSDLDALREAALVNFIHIVHPNRHPDPLVAGFIAVGTEGDAIRTAASATLRALTGENLAVSSLYAAKIRWVAPSPCLLPSKFPEPLDAFLKTRHIQYWIKSAGIHEHYSKTRRIEVAKRM